MKDFKFNKPKARKCLSLIHNAYKKKTYLFEHVHAMNGDAPQHKYVPKGIKKGSQKHQIFLFFANLLTYHSQSDMGFQQCVAVYESNPEFFTPKVWALEEKVIAEALKKAGFIYPFSTAKRWHKSAASLFILCDGKPLKIFEGRESIDDVLKLNNEKGMNVFPGLGPKLISLLNIFYNELELMPCLKGAFPVDIHVQAECMGMNLVTTEQETVNSTLLAEFLRIRIFEICEEKGFRPLDLSHAMWFLGNRICQFCHKKRAQSEHLCPVFKYCSGRVSTELYRTRGKWDMNGKHRPLFD